MSTVARVVLLPGLDGTGMLFGPLLKALRKDIAPLVIAYPPDRILSLPEHAEWVENRLPQGKPVLLAESFSGLVALALLAEAASRFESVIFVGCFAEPPGPFISRLTPLLPKAGTLMRSAPAFLLREYCLGQIASVDQLNLVRSAIKAVSPEVYSHRLNLISRRHSFGSGQFAVPCHYLQAAADRLVPPRCAQWFQKRFASCAVTRIDGPHFLLETRPAECAGILAQIVR
jgi:pimeloyl-ACP methyl ester carboxylesterase